MLNWHVQRNHRAAKTNTSKFQFDLETVDEEPPRGNATANSLLLLLLLLLSDYGIHADIKLISHDSAFSLASILLTSDFIRLVRVSTNLALVLSSVSISRL